MPAIFPATVARLEQWEAQPEVLGVILVGSKSREHVDTLSDDDLEVLLTDEAFAPRTPAECSEFSIEEDGENRKLIYDAQYLSLPALKDKLTSSHDLEHWPYEKAQVLFDRNGDAQPVVEALGRMDGEFRRLRLLHATIDTSIAIKRATKTLQRGYEGSTHLLVDRGAKALSRLLFALEWRWVPLDHWLEAELGTLDDPTEAGPQLISALKTGNPRPLQKALDTLEEWLFAEGVPRLKERSDLFLTLVHPSHAEERGIHGLY